MAELFDVFPLWENDKVMIRKMETSDVMALSEISNNENIYKYIPPFLYKKNNKTLETAIKNLGGRDFEKKKLIIAGIYLKDDPNRLVGLAEMFDYKKRENKIKDPSRNSEVNNGSKRGRKQDAAPGISDRCRYCPYCPAHSTAERWIYRLAS